MRCKDANNKYRVGAENSAAVTRCKIVGVEPAVSRTDVRLRSQKTDTRTTEACCQGRRRGPTDTVAHQQSELATWRMYHHARRASIGLTVPYVTHTTPHMLQTNRNDDRGCFNRLVYPTSAATHGERQPWAEIDSHLSQTNGDWNRCSSLASPAGGSLATASATERNARWCRILPRSTREVRRSHPRADQPVAPSRPPRHPCRGGTGLRSRSRPPRLLLYLLHLHHRRLLATSD